jgi:DNA-binding ferritin-like protein (Dps family)
MIDAEKSGFVSKVIGDKRRWREYKARVKQLPPDYRKAVEATERYLMYFGAITTGDTLMGMLEDLADLFEQSAAGGTRIRAIVGDEPVEFAETFLANYSEGRWISKERKRLVDAIDSVAGDDSTEEGGTA